MAASVRLAVLVLFMMLETWLATVLSVMISSSAISRLLLPAATSRSTSISRGLKPSGYSGARSGWEAARSLVAITRSIKGRMPNSLAMEWDSSNREKTFSGSPYLLRCSNASA